MTNAVGDEFTSKLDDMEALLTRVVSTVQSVAASQTERISRVEHDVSSLSQSYAQSVNEAFMQLRKSVSELHDNIANAKLGGETGIALNERIDTLEATTVRFVGRMVDTVARLARDLDRRLSRLEAGTTT